MPQVVLLGTGSAVSDGGRTTTMLAVEHQDRTMVIDCGGDVIQRLLAAGIDLDSIDALFITHEHPDHTSGFPLFMEKLWLYRRRRPIIVFGPEAGISQARRCFETFDTSGWEGMPEIQWREIPLNRRERVTGEAPWHVTASPGEHSVPVLGLRFDFAGSGRSLVYSADTGPCDAIIDLARNCDLLLHEASGEHKGHSSVAEAARVARDAGAGRLVLVHLPPYPDERELADARRIFADMAYGSDLERLAV